jgi:lipid II:glycine glycyltransferase (peptidoglycan interpeptide bridge formation enzyme)
MDFVYKEVTNQDQWESFVDKTAIKVSFIQSWAWSKFEESQGKKLWRIGIYQEQDLVGLMLITLVNARRGKYLHVRNGPMIDFNDVKVVKSCSDYLKQMAKEQDCAFVRISPLIPDNADHKHILRTLGFVDCQMHDVDAEITWVLDLTQSEEQIMQNMRKNTRYYVNRAVKDGVKIIKSTDPEDLKKFWPIFVDTVKRQQWNAYPYEYIHSEFQTFLQNNQALLMLAEYQGKYIAGSVFVYYKDTAYYHHSGSLSAYNKISASYLIQWEAIKEAKSRGLKTYNFFGIARNDDPKHPWSGLTFFKKGFGGQEQRHIHAQDLPVKRSYWLTHYYELFERKRRGY